MAQLRTLIRSNQFQQISNNVRAIETFASDVAAQLRALSTTFGDATDQSQMQALIDGADAIVAAARVMIPA